MTDEPISPHPEAIKHLEKAYAFEEQGKLEEALPECDAAIEADFDLAEAHNLRGIVLEELGQKKKAILAYRQAIRLDPNFQEAKENLEEIEAERKAEAENMVYCSACGHVNPSWRSRCEKCKTELSSPDRHTYTGPHGRPGCVTAYAILLCIGAGIAAVRSIISLSMEGATASTFFIVYGLGAGLGLGLARGVWQMRNWARLLVVVLQGFGLLVYLLSILRGLGASSDSAYDSGTNSTGTIVGIIIRFVVGGYVVYWFASHDEYFS